MIGSSKLVPPAGSLVQEPTWLGKASVKNSLLILAIYTGFCFNNFTFFKFYVNIFNTFNPQA